MEEDVLDLKVEVLRSPFETVLAAVACCCCCCNCNGDVNTELPVN